MRNTPRRLKMLISLCAALAFVPATSQGLESSERPGESAAQHSDGHGDHGMVKASAKKEMGMKSGKTDHANHPTRVIAILRNELSPTVQNLSTADAFGWLNYTPANATIRFKDPEIVSRMLCLSPGRFRVESSQLEAPEVPGGSFATLCSLKPGEYDYEVRLAGDDPTPLLGKLVVSPEI